jgi:hypothetical protein
MSVDIGEARPVATVEAGGDDPGARRPPGARTGHPSRRAVAWLAMLVVVLVVIGTGVWALVYRQTYQPLSAPLDNDATGAVLINSSHGQTGQWYDAYAPNKTSDVAVTLSNNGNRAVTIDRFYFGYYNVAMGPLTYDLPQWIEQVAPKAQRRPLDHTTIGAHDQLTIVVPLRWICDPPDHDGGTAGIGDMTVVYDFWGEHHTVMLPAPQPFLTTGGAACPAALKYYMRHGHNEGQ